MDLKKIIKDIKNGVMDIKEDLGSIKVRKKSSFVSITQSNIKAGGDVAAGDLVGGSIRSSFTQNINGKHASGTQRIWINGKEIDSSIAQSITEINITGNVKTVDTQGVVNVGGDVTGKIDTQGAVEVQGSVDGDINTQGSVTCGDVTGNVDTQGRVDCGRVGGDVDTMGRVTINR